ncbi:hypothetical protein OC25_06025 [Pedobacter kyungheensis]|uniref:Uncharacterized protein n=1 Tax=Pedobacter kyungheensis TaxID=1069985 RepID=A0A0C1DCN0_9SPHI|nr:hypothetical protein OC25_06025 [Pedobacter kyungheensis]
MVLLIEVPVIQTSSLAGVINRALVVSFGVGTTGAGGGVGSTVFFVQLNRLHTSRINKIDLKVLIF